MILTLDLATRTGWCGGRGDVVPAVGHFELDWIAPDYGLWLHSLRANLDYLGERFQPTRVCYEAPILKPTDNLTKLRRLYPLGPNVELWCRDRGVPCYEDTVAKIKRELAGHRHADKDAMMFAARKCGVKAVVHDEADAFGIWLIMVRLYARQHLERWDKILHGPRLI